MFYFGGDLKKKQPTTEPPTHIAEDKLKKYFVLLDWKTEICDGSQLLWEFIFSLASKIEPHMTHANHSPY